MDYLFRLIKDGKVVGYEKHEGGRIYHTDTDGFIAGDILFVSNRDAWFAPLKHDNYIPHDRKDLWTGIEVDGVKLFERDILEDDRGRRYEVRRVPGGFAIPTFPESPDKVFYESIADMQTRGYIEKSTKIIGIEGVKDEV